MKRFGRLFQFNSIQSQIIFFFASFLVVMAACIAGLLYNVLSGDILRTRESDSAAHAHRVAANTDAALAEVQAILGGAAYNDTVSQALVDFHDFTPYQRLMRTVEIQNLFRGLVMDKRHIAGIYLYSLDGAYYQYESRATVRRDSAHFREIGEQLAAEWTGGPHYTGVYLPDYYDPTAATTVFSVAIPVVHMHSYTARQVGVMMVSVDAGLLRGTTEQDGPGDGYNVYILRENGALLYAAGEDARQEALEAAAGHVGGGAALWADNNAIYAFSPSGVNGWGYLVAADLTGLQESLRGTLLMIIAMVAAGIAVTVLIAALITSRATGSIGNLIGYMDIIQQGDFYVDIPRDSSCKEIELAYVHLRGMMERINALIEENYLKELREQEAKLQSLQAQISPHFIGNTLQLITSLAVLGRNEDIEVVSAKLAEFFSYVVYEPGTIRLGQELDYIRCYMDIQNVRHQGRYALRVDVPEELLELRISKLLLQPLVENAVLHGFGAMEEACEVAITARVGPGELRFEIRDNGAGILPERLAELRRRLAAGEQTAAGRGTGRGIGLDNVAGRLRLAYGPGCVLEVDSEPGRCTRFRFAIPAGRAPCPAVDAMG